jgi:hypothetical protein
MTHTGGAALQKSETPLQTPESSTDMIVTLMTPKKARPRA